MKGRWPFGSCRKSTVSSKALRKVAKRGRPLAGQLVPPSEEIRDRSQNQKTRVSRWRIAARSRRPRTVKVIVSQVRRTETMSRMVAEQSMHELRAHEIE